MASRPRPRVVRLILVAGLASAGALAASPAAAQSAAERASARRLMDEGDAKRDKQEFAEALEAYRGADDIMHVPTTGLEVARMEATLGHLKAARATLREVIDYPEKPNEPPPFTAARKAAEKLDAEIGRRIPTVTLHITGAPEGAVPTVTLDGRDVPASELAAPQPVDPGTHVFVVAAGANQKRTDVLVAEKESKTVEISLAPDEPVASEPAVQTTDEPSSPTSTGTILMISGFGLAAAGVAVGSVTGVLSFSKVDDIKQDCDGNTCPPSRAGDIDDAQTLGNVSTIAFIAGGVGAAVGVVGLLMGSRTSEAPPAAGAHAVIGPSYVGLSGAF